MSKARTLIEKMESSLVECGPKDVAKFKKWSEENDGKGVDAYVSAKGLSDYHRSYIKKNL